MERRGVGEAAGRIVLFLLLLGVMASSPAFVAASGAASLLKGSYQLNWDQNVDKAETGTTDVRKLKQTVELGYRGFLSPLVSNEVKFRFEQEINSNAPSVTRYLPTVDLGFKGQYWEAKAGGKRTHENSDEPGKTPKTTDSYFVEFFYYAPKSIPDLKAKYTLDTDFQEGFSDTRKQGVTLSSVYSPNNWLNMKGDYNRNVGQDRLKADADTEDEKSSGTLGIRKILSNKIKIDTQYSVEATHGATLKSDGTGAVPGSNKQDQSHTWKNTLGIRPFENTSLDGSYDFDLKQNLVTGEHNLTRNAKASVEQKMLKTLDFKADFGRNITEIRRSASGDDNRKTEDRGTVELLAKFNKQLDFDIKYQKKNTDEVHVDVTKNNTSATNELILTWTGELAPFWKASASSDKTDTYTNGVKTKIDTKYSLKTTFDFKAINLTLDPSYDITVTDNRGTQPNSDTRDFKFKVAHKVLTTRNMEARFDHTYGRKTDSLAQNIQRTDSTNGNLTWKDPFPGWIWGFDLTRQATDTSGDDLPPDITTSFGFKADYRFDQLSFNTSYKFDKKSLSDNSENFDAKVGWVAPKWDVSLLYSFRKTFSVAINEGYSISLTFKYNL
ncbi:MAG: hypothetical protein HZA60_05910 [Deltaproteobacteria bacterium]|nr:hypothetical protein [Deltaproteobacteria bacterium]